MRSILLSLALGAVAGIIDVIPMIIQKLDKYACFSAFVQWVIIGFIVTHIKIPGVEGWLKGTIIAVLMALPIIILVIKTDLKSVPIILIISAILGGVVGFLSDKI